MYRLFARVIVALYAILMEEGRAGRYTLHLPTATNLAALLCSNFAAALHSALTCWRMPSSAVQAGCKAPGAAPGRELLSM